MIYKRTKLELHLNRTILLLVLTLSALQVHAQKKKYYGYLYCHLSARGEWTAYSLSQDGKTFHDLIGGDAVYDVEKLSHIEGGARDPYICRTADGKGYLMVTTDMCHAKSHAWSNYGINLLKSDDLINWTSVTFDFRKGSAIFSDISAPDFYREYSSIHRVWAPQIFWDQNYLWPDGKRGGYFIYYSLLNSKEDSYDRIFYSYADQHFNSLTKPRLLIDWGYATIDADINYVPFDSLYHMMIKKEGGQPGIFTSVSKKLTGPYSLPDENDFINFEGEKKCEGVSAFQLIGDSTWRVGYVEYSSWPIKYRICRADNYLRNFHSPEDIQGVANPQHGSFLQVTKREYRRLQKWSDNRLKRQPTAETL